MAHRLRASAEHFPPALAEQCRPVQWALAPHACRHRSWRDSNPRPELVEGLTNRPYWLRWPLNKVARLGFQRRPASQGQEPRPRRP